MNLFHFSYIDLNMGGQTLEEKFCVCFALRKCIHCIIWEWNGNGGLSVLPWHSGGSKNSPIFVYSFISSGISTLNYMVFCILKSETRLMPGAFEGCPLIKGLRYFKDIFSTLYF